MLGADETMGGEVKLGYDSNNEQTNMTANGFARFNDNLDVLASMTTRSGGDRFGNRKSKRRKDRASCIGNCRRP